MNRKNCLFANTISGMKASTVYYSLLESAKLNNINLYDYLIYLFDNYKDLEVNTNSYLPTDKKIKDKFKIENNNNYQMISRRKNGCIFKDTSIILKFIHRFI